MSTLNIHFYDKIGKNPKVSPSICILELLQEFPRDSNEFELARVNEPSVFESMRFNFRSRLSGF